jgi:glucose-6-phosphate isomerase
VVPTALAGADVAPLLDEAEALYAALGNGPDNPGLALGAALGAASVSGRDKLVLSDDGTGIVGLGDWAEQLIAESTGKEGKGILPVVVEHANAAGARGASDTITATMGGPLRTGTVPRAMDASLAVNGPLGAQFLAWEYATAIAGRIIGINPFDQPNVAESKENTRKILDSGPPPDQPRFTEGPIQVYGGAGDTVTEVLGRLLAGVDSRGYLAVMAYLDRVADADAHGLRELLAAKTSRPVTFGWGPRFLHSTGQFHKGGPAVGSFLQITGEVTDDLPVPGRAYTFGVLQAAQAAGDRAALTTRHRPLVRLHLTDRAAGIAALRSAVESS